MQNKHPSFSFLSSVPTGNVLEGVCVNIPLCYSQSSCQAVLVASTLPQQQQSQMCHETMAGRWKVVVGRPVPVSPGLLHCLAAHLDPGVVYFLLSGKEEFLDRGRVAGSRRDGRIGKRTHLEFKLGMAALRILNLTGCLSHTWSKETKVHLPQRDLQLLSGSCHFSTNPAILQSAVPNRIELLYFTLPRFFTIG